MPTAAEVSSWPAAFTAGVYSVDRSAPLRVITPTSRSPSTTGAALTRSPESTSKIFGRSVPAGTVSGSTVMTWESWVNRSTPWHCPSVTTPTGDPFSTTTTIPCARLVSSASASPTVDVGPSVIGVS